jgi:hypothetical protein
MKRISPMIENKCGNTDAHNGARCANHLSAEAGLGGVLRELCYAEEAHAT